MTEIERLLHLWSDGALSQSEIRRLSELLDDREARRLLVRDFVGQALLKAEVEAIPSDDTGLETLLTSCLSDPEDAGAKPARERSTRRLVVAGVALLTCAAIGGAAFLFPAFRTSPDLPTLQSQNVAVLRFGNAVAADELQRSPLQPGDVVKAMAGPASIRYRDGSRLALEPEAEVRVLSADRKQLELRRGTVSVVASKQPAGRPMALETSMARAVVVGTRFTLKADPGATWLRVAEGSVRFEPQLSGSAPVTVEAGRFAVAAAGVDPQPRPNAEPGGENVVPLTIPWESAVAKGDGAWRIAPEGLSQTKVTSLQAWPGLYGTPSDPTSTLDAPVVASGSVLLEATVQVTHALEIPPSPNPNWQGFACRLGVRDQIVKLYFIDYGRTGMLDLSVARSEAASNGVDLAVDRCPPFGVGIYRMKLLLSRIDEARIRVAGKLWAGDTEPSDWMVRAEIPLRESVHRVGFETTHCACVFRDVRLSLVP